MNIENGFGYTPYNEACMAAKTYKSIKINEAESNKIQYEKWWNEIMLTICSLSTVKIRDFYYDVYDKL